MRWLRENLNFNAVFVGGKLLQSCCLVYTLHLVSVRLFKSPDSQYNCSTYFSKLNSVVSAKSSVTHKSENAANTSSLAVALDFPLNLVV